MKKYLFLFLVVTSSLAIFAQAKPKKIKIILLGTFHFNQSLDSASRIHSNLFSDKRQKEILEIIDKLSAQKPDKVFLEFTEKNQPFYDSIYLDYLKGKEPEKIKTKANEIFQLGMRVAKKLGHKKVIGMNYQPEELGDPAYIPKNGVDSVMRDLYAAIGNHNDSTRTNTKFYDLPYPNKLPKQDSLLQKSTLSQFLVFLNSEEKLKRDEFVNWNFLYSVGTGTDMSTTDYVGTFWYGANLRNFNNVLRNVDYEKDKCYLIIYGASHIPILKYFFNMHPYFELVDVSKILN